MWFYIVTPSFNQLEFLKRCVASVADQVSADSYEPTANSSVTVHHHVQDAGSTDGTREFLAEHLANSSKRSAVSYTFSYESAPDEGMYDAINRGWKLASDDVDIVAHLNCDEQYLSVALRMVADCFRQNKDVDIVFADVIVTNPDGTYICSRRSVLPNKNHVLTSHLPTFTAATFVRAQAIREHGLYFDCSWKYCGDADWALRRMNAGVTAMVLRKYTTTFADTGENMDLGKNAREERVFLSQRAILLVKWLKWFWVLQHRLQKLLAGGYARVPVEYSIYQNTNEDSQRTCFHVDHASGVWKDRL